MLIDYKNQNIYCNLTIKLISIFKSQICRNSKIVLGEEDVSAKDQGIIKLGIRVDQFNINQTILNQDGNVCPSVLEVCCNVNDGKVWNQNKPNVQKTFLFPYM